MRTERIQPAGVGALVAIAGATAWWVTGLRPFTDPPLLLVPLSGGVAMVLGARFFPPRRASEVKGRQLAVWGALVATLAAWQLAAFVHQPRQDHPTISSLLNNLFESHPARALSFLFWLAGAAVVARR